MRQSFPIITLLLAAVAGAESAPPAAPAAGPSATHEVRDRASGQTMACACRASGQGRMTCDQCAPTAERPTIRVTGTQSSAPVWVEVIERTLGDARMRALLAELEIKANGYFVELAITCRNRPDDRRYVDSGLLMPQNPEVLARRIHGIVERECTKPTAEPAQETTWGGCPAEDDHDRNGLNRTATPKIRITARPDSHGDEWSRLRLDLVMDDLIYHCAQEFIIDPVSASGAGAEATFRANVTLVCANDPTRRAEFDTVVPEMNRGDFRRFIGKMLKRTCGLPATTASRGAR